MMAGISWMADGTSQLIEAQNNPFLSPCAYACIKNSAAVQSQMPANRFTVKCYIEITKYIISIQEVSGVAVVGFIPPRFTCCL